MENENKDNKELINLTDEQLKEVAGGITPGKIQINCKLYPRESCVQIPFCIWKRYGCEKKE